MDGLLKVIVPSDDAEVLSNFLVDGSSHGAQLLSGALCQLFVDGEGDVHRHSICAHIYCVNLWAERSRHGLFAANDGKKDAGVLAGTAEDGDGGGFEV